MNRTSELEEGYVDGDDMYPVDGPLQSGTHSLRRIKSTMANTLPRVSVRVCVGGGRGVYVCVVFVCVCVCVCVCVWGVCGGRGEGECGCVHLS